MIENPPLFALLVTVAGGLLGLLGYAIGTWRRRAAVRRAHFSAWRDAEDAFRKRLEQLAAEREPAPPMRPHFKAEIEARVRKIADLRHAGS